MRAYRSGTRGAAWAVRRGRARRSSIARVSIDRVILQIEFAYQGSAQPLHDRRQHQRQRNQAIQRPAECIGGAAMR